MSLVLDASAAVAWLYREHDEQELMRLYEVLLETGAQVPQLWRIEIANVLLTGLRKRRHDAEMVFDYLSLLSSLEIAVDQQSDLHAWGKVLDLAMQHRLTTYDAGYLELAIRQNIPLATLDRHLAVAAGKEKVQLFWRPASA